MQKTSSRKGFNYSLFFSLMVLSFIPSINEAIKVLFVNTSDASLIEIASQIEWFDLINEVLTVTLTIPMYSILNRYIGDKEIFKTKVFHCGVITLLLYTAFSIVTYINASNLVNSMVTSSVSEIEIMVSYLKLETIAFVAGIVFTYLNIVFIILGKSKYIYCFVIIKTISLIISNAILIPKYGSFGIAYSNIITNVFLGSAAIALLIKDDYISVNTHGIIKDTGMFKEWGRVGVLQGISVAVANIAYAQLVVKMIGKTQGLGEYWIANNFIWGWLLIPSFALAETVRGECKEGYKDLNTKDHLKIIYSTIIIWVLTIPLWSLIFKYALRVTAPREIYLIVLKLLPFYGVFLFSNYLESIFQGMGKTNYCCLASLLVNSVYYGSLFILSKNGYIDPSLNFVILMFGFGMVFVFAIYYILKRRYLDSVMEQA